MRPADAIRVLPILNNKGGVGKTTTSVNLAAGLAQKGHRTLVVDLDGQRSASLHLGLARDVPEHSSAEVLFGTCTLTDAICPTRTPGLDLLPGSPALAQADVLLGSNEQPVGRLAEVLRPARNEYDFILLDCAPSISLLNINVLVAADALIVPLSLSYLAVEGLSTLDSVKRKVWAARGRMVPILGILRTVYDARSPAQRMTASAIAERYGGKPFSTSIRECEEIAAASRAQCTVFEYAPESGGAADYEALATEVEERSVRYAHVFSPDCPLAAEQESAVAEAAFGPAWSASA